MLFDSATRRWRDLGAEHVNSPTWSSDSKYIYHAALRGTPAILRVRVGDGRREQVVSLEGLRGESDLVEWAGAGRFPPVVRNVDIQGFTPWT